MSQPHSVKIDPQVCSNGIAQLKGSCGPLETSWNDLLGQIVTAHAANPWGEDKEGQDFQTSYLTDAKAGTFKTDCKPVTDIVFNWPENVERAIKLSYAADGVAAGKIDQVDINPTL